MRGHDGFISIFSDVDWNGTVHSFPQVLYADSEELSGGKDIKTKPFQVGQGRVAGTGALVSGPIKPEGSVKYQFRSDDCLKTLMAHFQMGTLFESGSMSNGTFQYGFYPSRSTPSYQVSSGYGEGSYGAGTGYVYSVSVLKRLMTTSQYNGTNSMLFRHGIVDKLGFELGADSDAKLTSNYKFRDLDYGTKVDDVPDGTLVGSYSRLESFKGWSGTVLVGGQSLELTGLVLQSNNGIEESSRVGRMGPEEFRFGEYNLKGNFVMDVPKDAMRFVGSMFTMKEFAILATLYNGANDQVVLDLPTCKYLPFDFKNEGGRADYSGAIPFQALSSAGGYPIKVTVNSTYEFEGLGQFMDALSGARTVTDFEIIDAESGARTLSDYEIMDRDA